MKKSTKRSAAAMAAAMSLSLALSACGGSSSAAASSTATAASDSTAVSSATTAAKPVADLPEGLEWMTPFDETVTLNVCVGWDADSSVKDGTTPETNALVQLAKDYLNIELNFLWMVPNDQLSERLALQFSSGELPDIVMLDSENFYEFLDSDYLRDLTDAYNNDASDDVKNILNMLGEAPMQYASRDGKLYGIPAALDPTEGVAGLYYRSDWLDGAERTHQCAGNERYVGQVC